MADQECRSDTGAIGIQPDRVIISANSLDPAQALR